MKLCTALSALLVCVNVSAETYLKEQFAEWPGSWDISTKWKSSSDLGKLELSHGEFYGDEKDFGIKTGEDARFYGFSRKLDKPFNSEGKTLVLQYSVKHEGDWGCGGAYIKLLPGGDSFDAPNFGGDTPYAVMFGPDICGSSKRTHVIFNYEDDNKLIKKDVLCEKDKFTHLYRLVVRPDNTFEVSIDGKSVRDGKLEDEFDMLPAKEIKDPDQSKPDDWVDQKKMPDPEDAKPDGHDDIAAEIPDPDASKPEDWDDEDDGEWEPPMIANPDHKGPWRQKQIDNPAYKGAWEHPMVSNPDYKPDDKLYNRCVDCTHVGFELWQVSAGTIFDNIIVTDSVEEAQAFAEETYFKNKDGEKAMQEEQQKEADAKAEESAAEAGEDDDDAISDDDDLDAMGDEF